MENFLPVNKTNQKRKRKLVCCVGLFVLGCYNIGVAQQGNVGIGTAVPDRHSILDIVSDNKGLLIPRLDETQRNNIFSAASSVDKIAAKGLLIYNKTTVEFNYWDGDKWNRVGNGTSASKWYSGNTDPAIDPTLGLSNQDFNDADYYLNNLTGKIYRNIGKTTWQEELTIIGKSGPQWFSGNVFPSITPPQVIENDLYLNTASGDVYRYGNGTWGLPIANLTTGVVGPKGDKGDAGPQWFSGISSPSLNAGVIAVDRDMYLNTLSGEVFRYENGNWTGPIANLTTGIIGPQGVKGDVGATGAIGPVGPVGPQGIQGIQGIKGDVGPIGPQGLQGEKGEIGIKGDVGLIGPQGIQGLQGNVGPVGPAGPIGPQGIKGDTGNSGAQGLQGNTGPAGPIGPQGAKGDTGNTGPQGLIGPVGSAGPIGPQGIKGDTGNPGTQGLQGNTGPAGPIGPQGAKGDTGNTGPQGLIGPVGPAGPIGPQGIKGDTGNPGAQGLQGNTGPAGPIGPQGIKGDTGDTGAQGLKGNTGDTGPVGSLWYEGSGAPSLGLGKDNDFFLNRLTGDVYKKINSLWAVVANIKGPAGTNDSWQLTGNGGTSPAVSGSSGSFLGTSDSKDLVMGAGGQELLRFKALNGYIGINQNVPLAQLHVNGDFILGVDGNKLNYIAKTKVNTSVLTILKNSALVQTYNFTLAQVGATVSISPKEAMPDGLMISYARVKQTGVIEVKFYNATSSDINLPVSEFNISLLD